MSLDSIDRYKDESIGDDYQKTLSNALRRRRSSFDSLPRYWRGMGDEMR